MRRAAVRVRRAVRSSVAPLVVAPPPLFTPLRLRELTLANRVVVRPWPHRQRRTACRPPIRGPAAAGGERRARDCVLTEPVAVAAEGRITPDDPGLYTPEQARRLGAASRATVHTRERREIGAAAEPRRAAGRDPPRSDGLDRPLREGGWPLLAPSPLPYTPRSQTPQRDGPRRYGRDARRPSSRRRSWRDEAGFDLLQLHMAHGYLLASFLSPLTNQRDDEYGGDAGGRLRFPLEVFDAVRAVWPAEKPLAVALTVTDGRGRPHA